MLATMIALTWIGLGTLVFAWWYRHEMRACWEEPCLAKPVLVIESDDWGPAAAADAVILKRLAMQLQHFRDCHGRHPVMTIGALLSVPDTGAIRENGLGAYSRIMLDDEAFMPVRDALVEGARCGVFSLQLHGLEHFWPETLLRLAQSDAGISQWLTGEQLPDSAELLPALQSRWTDASVLPSLPLASGKISAAVLAEVSAFTRIFGMSPRVVVPPTFVWNEEVEAAWAGEGIEVIVTPGRRFSGRDRSGKLIDTGIAIHNAQHSKAGPAYIVRNNYFEPSFGHTADEGLASVARCISAGRPALFETHRFNFTSGSTECEHALKELDKLLEQCLSRYPDMVFLSTYELYKKLVTTHSSLLVRDFRVKLRTWLVRLLALNGIRKPLLLSGAIISAGLIYALGRSSTRDVVPETMADGHG